MTDETLKGLLYFAYGDDVNFRQMAMQAPAAQAVKAVALDGYELLFRSVSDSGAAAIAPKEGSTVYGVLWRITPEWEHTLDRPYPYNKVQVTVRSKQGQEFSAMTYTPGGDLEPALPSSRYFATMRAGYRWFRLPFRNLKQAWDHAVQEVYQQTERAYLEISKPSWRYRKRDDYER